MNLARFMNTGPALLLAGALGSAVGWPAPPPASERPAPAAARIETAPPGLPPGVDPVKAGEELAANLRTMVPAENAQIHGTLKLRKPEDKTFLVPVTATTTVTESGWQVVYETRGTPDIPPERLTIIHSTNAPTVYLYAQGRELDRPTRLAGDKAMLPFAGSDFWMMDLGLEFFQWPHQRLVKVEMRRGRSSRVLESTNPQRSGAGYSRVLSWIDVETDGLLSAEAYDARNKLLKEFKVDSLRKVEGRWEIKDLLIRNVQARTSTELQFEPSQPK